MWTLQFLGKFHGFVPLFLRALVGTGFAFFHGYDKIMGPEGFDGGADFVKQTAGAAPTFFLYVGAWTEFLAGLGLLVGLFTRWAAIGIVAVMSYAIFGIHWAQGFALHVDQGSPAGYEVATAYATMSLCIMVMGPGSLSLDRLFFHKAALNA